MSERLVTYAIAGVLVIGCWALVYWMLTSIPIGH